MYDAILFDLDDTLLRNEMNTFVDAYWRTLLPKLSAPYPDHNMKQAILDATQAMIRAKRSTRTLREVFIEVFQQQTRLDFQDLEPVFMDYYRNEYRQIRDHTQLIPGALSVLKAAQDITPIIVLATIPIFPRIAILERMLWAGIDQFPFCMITSFENMHAGKPNPEYYQEIADTLDVKTSSCLMIGNDLVDDMVAAKVGMKTFLVTDYINRREESSIVPDYQGSLQELTAFFGTFNS